MWALWATIAAAEPCPAATEYLVATGMREGFEDSLWSQFTEGMAASAPPELRDVVRERTRGFWEPILGGAVDLWRAELVEPMAGEVLAELVPCRSFERAARRPDGRARAKLDRQVHAALGPFRAQVSARMEPLMLALMKDVAPTLQEHAAEFRAVVAQSPPL